MWIMSRPKFNDFGCSMILSGKANYISELTQLENFLNLNFSLATYGSGISRICFLIIIIHSNRNIQKEELRYCPSKKQLLIAGKMDSQKLIRSSKTDVFKVMAEAFISFVNSNSFPEIPDFDVFTFGKDLRAVFKKSGLVLDDF